MKKAAARAAKGQKSLGASVAVALTRADATANGKNASASVEWTLTWTLTGVHSGGSQAA